jgi:hypothetical protein
MMITPARLNDGSKVIYGYGFGIFSDPWQNGIVHHGGSISGFHAYLIHYQQQDITIAVLTNTIGDHAFNLVFEEIEPLLLKK